MPEIKNTFTKGRMNKDIETRLVPNGEYLDAVNIQVATAEGGDVGAVTNILGNSLVAGQDFIAENAVCVGSISDEKNDKLYWFVYHNSGNLLDINTSTFADTDGNLAFGDEWPVGSTPPGWIMSATGARGIAGTAAWIQATVPEIIQDNIYTFKYDLTTATNTAGNFVLMNHTYTSSSLNSSTITNPTMVICTTPAINTAVGTYEVQWLQAGANPSVLQIWGSMAWPDEINNLEVYQSYAHIIEYDNKNKEVRVVFTDNNNDVLKLHPDQLITGINVIDDMLFWTDNHSEPKKINITRSIQGTNPNGLVDTKLLIPGATPSQIYSNGPPIEEEHITVIRKAPKKPPVIELIDARDPALTYTGIMKVTTDPGGMVPGATNATNLSDLWYSGTSNLNHLFDFSSHAIGSEIRTTIKTDIGGNSGFTLNWAIGDIILFKEFGGLNFDEAPPIPITNYRIKAKITAIDTTDDANEQLTNGDFVIPDTASIDPNSWTITAPAQLSYDPILSQVNFNTTSVNHKLYSTPLAIVEGDTYTFTIEVSNPPSGIPLGSLNVVVVPPVSNTATDYFDPGNLDVGNSVYFNIFPNITGPGVYTKDVTFLVGQPEYAHTPAAWVITHNNRIFIQNPAPITDLSVDYMKMEKVVDDADVKCTILDIQGQPPTPSGGFGSLSYAVDLYDETEKLFEFKFPRFAYRYKYEDGEYSTISPWSEVAFIPGAFDYNPKRGYNLAMINHAKEILVKNFKANISSDVVGIDILYKDDYAPTIYVVDTIKPRHTKLATQTSNSWALNEVSITSELVKNAIATNQLLRHWDAVPRKALAQDVSGNRIIYGNYLQGYNMEWATYPGSNTLDTQEYSVTKPYQPNFDFSIVNYSTTISNTVRSIKSLREYQLGIVFLDEYGRETPVISNTSGEARLDKTASPTSNELQISFHAADKYPDQMKYFKFFVKQTSGEYYNLAMDRFYIDEDDSIWLSFPSTERNKVDIDTFLILKKGLESTVAITTKARYNILAIENEAPDFIKLSNLLIENKVHDSATQNVFGTGVVDAPILGRDIFRVNYSPFFQSSGEALHELEEGVGGILYVEFANNLTNPGVVSKRYRVNTVTSDIKEDQSNSGAAFYSFMLDENLGPDIAFISDDPTGQNPTLITNGSEIRIYRYIAEDFDKFEGRFFVKINEDVEFTTNIVANAPTGTTSTFRVVETKKLCSMRNETHHYRLHDSYLTGQDWGVYASNIPGPSWNTSLGWDYSGFGRFAPYFRNYNASSSSSLMRRHSSGPAANPAMRNVGDYMFHAGANGVNVSSGPSAAERNRSKYELFWFTTFVSLDHNSTGGLWGASGPTSPNPGQNPPGDPLSTGGNGYAILGAGSSPWPGGNSSMGVYPSCSNASGTSPSPNVSQPNYQARPFRLPDGAGNVKCADGGNEDDLIWFIDGGRYTGHDTGNYDRVWSSGGAAGPAASSSDGFKTVGSTMYLELATGPIYDSTFTFGSTGGCRPGFSTPCINLSGAPWNIPASSGASNPTGGNNGWPNPVWPNYFDIGVNGPTANINYANTALTNFVNKLAPGTKIRFPGDPHNEIYSVKAVAWGSRSKMRFTNIRKPMGTRTTGWYAGTNSSTNCVTDNANYVPQLSPNHTKGWRLELQDSSGGNTIAWNPFAQGSGPIATGRNIPLTASGASAAPGNVTITVNTLVGVDSTTGDNVAISPGMLLTSYVSSAGTHALTHQYADINTSPGANEQLYPLLIASITGGPGAHILHMCGYDQILSNADYIDPATAQYRIFEHQIFTNLPNGALIFQQPHMNGLTEFSANRLNAFDAGAQGWTGANPGIKAVCYDIQFVEELIFDTGTSTNPAIWETEPKENTPLDVYYEASEAYPLQIDNTTATLLIPLTSAIELVGGATIPPGTFISSIIGETATANQSQITLSQTVLGGPGFITTGDFFKITRPDGSAITVQVVFADNVGMGSNPPNQTNTFTIATNTYSDEVKYHLNWHNCYTFGNGVESNRIKDAFNLPFISNGVKASTTLDENYGEERRKYGLIYSGIYNGTIGINNLNQFIAAEKITKDVNPIYGSIQKLHSRDTDLITLCEDKVLKILADKDAIFNADGNPQLTANINVLGQTIPFVGEFGISKNPESFASESFRAYFSDQVRGTVMRLSKDGLTPISDHGMKNWFRDNLSVTPHWIIPPNITMTTSNWLSTIAPGSIYSGLVPPSPISEAWDVVGGVAYANRAKGWLRAFYTNTFSMQNIMLEPFTPGEEYEITYDVVRGASAYGLDPIILTNQGFNPAGGGNTNVNWVLPQSATGVSAVDWAARGGEGQAIGRYKKRWVQGINFTKELRMYIREDVATGYRYALTNITVKKVQDKGKIIGSYDDKKGEYNITMPLKSLGPMWMNPDRPELHHKATLSFSEQTKGWVSLKSFLPESAVSCANDYFTMKHGKLYEHHDKNSPRNTFYANLYDDGVILNPGFYPSRIKPVLNESPSVIKNFRTLNYEGTQSKINAQNSFGWAFETLNLIFDNDTSTFNGNATANGWTITGTNSWNPTMGGVQTTLGTSPGNMVTNVPDIVLGKTYRILYNISAVSTGVIQNFELSGHGPNGVNVICDAGSYGPGVYQTIWTQGNVNEGVLDLYLQAGFTGATITWIKVQEATSFTTADQYYNMVSKDGWYCEWINTGSQSSEINAVTPGGQIGGIMEFIEKEGKWFNYIKGHGRPEEFNTNINSEFNVQGIGMIQSIIQSPVGSISTVSNINSGAAGPPNFPPANTYMNTQPVGKYFYALGTEAAVMLDNATFGLPQTSSISTVVYVEQVRPGISGIFWQGNVRMWGFYPGSNSTATEVHGRKNVGSAPGDWQIGDEINVVSHEVVFSSSIIGSLNESLQEGDKIYYATPTVAPNGMDEITIASTTYYGELLNIDNTVPSISLRPEDTLQDPYDTSALSVAPGDYVFFAKDPRSNTSGIIGPHAVVSMYNDSKEFAEIFALSSEVTQSSK